MACLRYFTPPLSRHAYSSIARYPHHGMPTVLHASRTAYGIARYPYHGMPAVFHEDSLLVTYPTIINHPVFPRHHQKEQSLNPPNLTIQTSLPAALQGRPFPDASPPSDLPGLL